MPMWGGNSLPPVLVEIPKLMFLCSQSDQRARFRVPRRTHEELAKFPPCWLTFRNLTFRIVFWSYVEMRDCNRKTFPLVAVTCSGGLWVFQRRTIASRGVGLTQTGNCRFRRCRKRCGTCPALCC